MKKKIKIILSKKSLAILLIIITLFSNISPVLAASGTANYAAGQFASYIFTTDNSDTTYGVLIRRLVNVSTGEGKTVFCSEHGVDISSGTVHTGSYYTPTSATVKKACKVAYFGWYSKYGDYLVNGGMSSSAKLDYVLTQQYIWEVLGQSSATFIDSSIQAQYETFKSTINAQINNTSARPSFDSSEIEITAGESVTVTDSNGILASYNSIDVTKDGVRFQHTYGENTLTITVNDDCEVENLNIYDSTTLAWGLIKSGTEDNDTTIYFEFNDDVQEQLYALNYNDPVTLAFSLKINLLGNLELSKLNTNSDLVDGSVFTVSGPGYNGDVEVKDGKITLEKIKKGTYTITEKSVGTGYLLNTDTYYATVYPNQTTTQAIVNKEPTGELTLIKTDSETENSNRADETSHHGDATLNGTVYTLYANEDIYNVAKTIKYFSKNEEIATFTFNSYGQATIKITNTTTSAKLQIDENTLKGLPMGNYIAKETVVPTGYTEDTETHTITFNYKDMNTKVITLDKTLENTVQKAKFEVIKISSNTNTTAPVIEGAEFTAILSKYVEYYGSFDEALKHLDEYAEDEYSIFTTDETGHGVSGLLAYGEYTVYETYTPSDEIETVLPFYILIDKNSDGVIKEFIENDIPFESYIKLVKIDKDTGKTVILNNATFTLYKLNEDTEEWEQVSCKLGKESFNSWTTDETGTAYTETKLSAGTYKVEEIEIPDGYLELDEELTFQVNQSNKTLEFDEDYDAYITVYVENSKPTGTLIIDKTVALRDDADLSLVDISDLSNIKFRLTAKEDIIDMADGPVIYYAGDVIGEYNLDENGDLSVDNLYMGVYELEEIETLNGLALNNEKYEVRFTQEDTTTKVYTETKEIVNDTTIVEFSKTDITGDEELVGATLTVTDDEENVIDTWVSGETTHKIEGLVVGNTYTLKEEIQVEGYVKATDIEFTIENTNTVQKVTMIDKVVDVTKTDMVNGEEVEGAELIVTDEEGNEIDRWISEKEPHHVVGLEEGKTYYLEEITCPYGYEVAEKQEFTVTTDKETQVVEMKDMPIMVSIQVEKVDEATGEHIKSNKFTFGIFADAECTELIAEVGANTFEGTALFEGIRYGNFYIKELQAPLGYSLSDQVVEIVVDDTGVYADGVSLEETDGIYSFVYYNSLLPAIQTGNETNYTLLVALAIISLIGITTGVIILKKKSKKN